MFELSCACCRATSWTAACRACPYRGIANGADVKIVQARPRHGAAKVTLDTYGHLWPDKDESTMAIVDSVFKARFEGLADSSRTAGGAP